MCIDQTSNQVQGEAQKQTGIGLQCACLGVASECLWAVASAGKGLVGMEDQLRAACHDLLHDRRGHRHEYLLSLRHAVGGKVSFGTVHISYLLHMYL